MILRFARHGQPALDGMPPGANHELPPGDFPLSALGRRQALFLGRHLQSVGFRGTIIASPYARTAETASIAASVCGNVFYPDPRLQDMRVYPAPPCPGMTLEELRRNYENLAPDAVLTFPWLTPGGVEELIRASQDFEHRQVLLESGQHLPGILLGNGVDAPELLRQVGLGLSRQGFYFVADL